jgi:hypothetical protein
MMARATALAFVLVAACGDGPDAPEAELQLAFPGERAGTIPFEAGGAFDVDVTLAVPRLCTSTRATVEIVSASAPTGSKVTDLLALVPFDDCTLRGRSRLVWPPGGEIELRAAAAGTTATGRVSIGTPPQLALTVTAEPATLPAPGSIVLVTVAATSGAAAAAGVPVALAALPATQVLPSPATTDASGIAQVRVLVPAGALELRIEAVAGSARAGVTLAP